MRDLEIRRILAINGDLDSINSRNGAGKTDRGYAVAGDGNGEDRVVIQNEFFDRFGILSVGDLQPTEKR
jgi:hypothetical protein